MTIFNLRLSGDPGVGELWLNSLHFQSPSLAIGAAAPIAQRFADHLWNGNGSDIVGIAPYFSATTTLVSGVLDSLNDVTGKVSGQVVLSVTSQGTDDGEVLPPNVSEVVTLRTAVFGPAGRGRIYLPAMSVTNCVGGRIPLLVTQDIAATVWGCIAEAAEDDLVLAVYHRETRSFSAVTSVDMGDVFDQQTRRRDKLVEVRRSAP